MNLDKYPDVLTLRECQKILQVSRGTMLRLLHEGEIPAFRIGNRGAFSGKKCSNSSSAANTENNRNEPFRLGIPMRNHAEILPFKSILRFRNVPKFSSA